MTDAFGFLDVTHERVAYTDWGRNGRLLGHKICNLNMAAKADNLVADGMLKARNHRHGNNHHCQSDGYANGSNSNSRTANLLTVTALSVYLPCYE